MMMMVLGVVMTTTLSTTNGLKWPVSLAGN